MIELADARWPGFSPSGAILLPLPRERFLRGPGTLRHRGTEYHAKSELHATLIGTRAGKACLQAIHEGRGSERELAAGFEREQWRIERTGRFLELAESDHPDAKRSIIELLELPAMQRFREHCARVCHIDLPHAPPHVTLYVAGGSQGIGLPDDATLERLCRGEVPPEKLGAD